MTSKLWAAVAMVLLALPVPGAPAEQAGERIGLVHVEREGVASAPEPLRAGRVRTDEWPAVLELDNGRVLRLGQHTAVELRRAGPREIEVTVGRGLAWVTETSGRRLGAGQNSVFVLGPPEGAPDALWPEPAAADPLEQPDDDERAPAIRPRPRAAP